MGKSITGKLLTKRPKVWSTLFDAVIVAADFIVGFIIYPRFNSLYVQPGTVSEKPVMIMCGISLLLAAMYVAGLLANRGNFRAEEAIRFSTMDSMAFMFNAVLLSAIFAVVLMELFPAVIHPVVIMIITFGFMGGWTFLHWHILNKESRKSGDIPSIKRKIIGFILVFPFVTALSLPITVLAGQMNLYQKNEAITLSNTLLYPLFVGSLLAVLAWFLYFIPRKMLKGFSGVNIRSRFFFIALIIDYTIRLTSISISYFWK